MRILSARTSEDTDGPAVRPRAPQTPPSSEQGAVAIIVAAALTMLMGFAALAIDLTVIYNWRRADQNGADHASLAAAWAWCNGDDPTAAGLAAAADNGFNNDGTTNTVSVDDLGGGQFEVTITSTVEGLFAGAIGFDDLQTEADATAGCVSGGGGSYALFAKGENCGDKAIDWSGSNNQVTGNVHSNDGILMGGQNNTVEGQTTYYGDIQQEEDDNFTPEPLQVSEPVSDYPVSFNIADYAPGGAKATAAQAAGQYYNAGSQKIDSGWLKSNTSYNDTTKTLATGLYYTTGEIDLGDSNIHGTVTLVSASNVIKLGGSNQDPLQAWDPDGLLLFSTATPSDPCNTSVIEVSGSGSRLIGIVYGPYGLIAMPGSGPPVFGSTVEGSLIGYAVRLSGQNVSISAPEDTGGEEPPKVSLLE